MLDKHLNRYAAYSIVTDVEQNSGRYCRTCGHEFDKRDNDQQQILSKTYRTPDTFRNCAGCLNKKLPLAVPGYMFSVDYSVRESRTIAAVQYTATQDDINDAIYRYPYTTMSHWSHGIYISSTDVVVVIGTRRVPKGSEELTRNLMINGCYMSSSVREDLIRFNSEYDVSLITFLILTGAHTGMIMLGTMSDVGISLGKNYR